MLCFSISGKGRVYLFQNLQFLCTTVHVIISFSASFLCLSLYILYIDIPKAGWDGKKKKNEPGNKIITWTVVHWICNFRDYWTRLRFWDEGKLLSCVCSCESARCRNTEYNKIQIFRQLLKLQVSSKPAAWLNGSLKTCFVRSTFLSKS